ncbi:MAG: FAD-dependent oxidoreductase [Desulfobacterales bacterium]|jgi:NADPH-dependent 2,4-dienoyl-CoA reductase/sulfur reductase-like enzyme|nr:FAD-dependent oxidoreductase [Desulfobacterales bacterium]
MDFVIIGGDAAGMSAASRARRHLPGLTITVFEKTQDVSYSACGMPYNIADASSDIEALVVRHAQVFRDKQDIHLLTGHEVTKIDIHRKQVSGITLDGASFSHGYDKLLIATGASPTIPPIPGVDLPGVLPLKNLEDGRKIKSFLADQPVQKTVIIGMGYIALEMCEALSARGIQVDMVKPRPGLLPWMAPELSTVVIDTLSAHHVGVHDGHHIKKIEKEASSLRVVCKELTLSADMVLVATGVQPNSAIAAAAGISLGAGSAIAVDSFMRTSVEDIYAAGDCADALHVVTGKSAWIPLALRANRSGWAVADSIAGKATALEGIAGTAVFRVFDLEVARSGLTEKEALAAGFTPESVTIQSRSRAHGHPGATPIWVHMVGDKGSGRLLGTQMVGHEGTAHRINAIAVALHNKMTVAQFSQTDLAYAPPFGPVWDPMLTAAVQLMKQI